MRLATSIAYLAGPADVLAMLLTEEFQHQVCQQTGASSHEVSISGSAVSGSVISTTRTLPADQLPDFVRSFAGGHLTVRRVDTWDPITTSGTRGRIVVEILGTPVRFSGDLSLLATGTGTTEEVQGELKASVPLLGRKIEQAAKVPIELAIAKEHQVGQAWLAARS